MNASGRRAAIAVAFSSALMIGGMVLAAPASAAPSVKWAWIVERDPKATQNPGPRDRGNSSGGVNSIVKLFGQGWYGVILPGVQPEPGAEGNVLVSTFGSTPKNCVAGEITAFPDEVQVVVYCFDRTGDLSNAGFILDWLTVDGMGGQLAYATDNSPTSVGAALGSQYDSHGGTITGAPVHQDPGEDDVIEVTIPGLGDGRALPHVSARFSKPTDEALSDGSCVLGGFYPVNNVDHDEVVQVRCYDVGGEYEVYRRFHVWLMQGLGLKGAVRSDVAHVFADRPKAHTYAPDISFSKPTATNRVERLGQGRYSVTLPGMPKGGATQVTPFAGTSRHCVIVSIRTEHLPQRVGVRCFDAAGDLVDSKFTLSYAK